MPPIDEVRRWMYVYYSVVKGDADARWLEWSKYCFRESKAALRITDKIRREAAVIAGSAVDDKERIRRIYDYCRTKIRNVSYDVGASEADKRKVAKPRSTNEILESGMGNSADIDFLYGALPRGVGLDARFVMVGDRSEKFFERQVTIYDLSFGGLLVGVLQKGAWTISSPGSRYETFGRLNWWAEGQIGLVSDESRLIWIDVPITPASDSMIKSSGSFKLLPHKSLVGNVRVEFTGHSSYSKKAIFDELSPEKQREWVVKEVLERIPNARVSEISIENVTDPEKPFAWIYSLTIPDMLGRMQLESSFSRTVFQLGSKPLFVNPYRTSDIHFEYPWSDVDEITIEIPAGLYLRQSGHKRTDRRSSRH